MMRQPVNIRKSKPLESPKKGNPLALTIFNPVLELTTEELDEITKQNMNALLVTHMNTITQKAKLTKRQSDALYNRLLKKDNSIYSKKAERVRKYKQKQFQECTYQPKINRSKSFSKIRNRQGIIER